MPKRDRMFGDQKTTTAEGKAEYQREYMREYRGRKKQEIAAFLAQFEKREQLPTEILEKTDQQLKTKQLTPETVGEELIKNAEEILYPYIMVGLVGAADQVFNKHLMVEDYTDLIRNFVHELIGCGSDNPQHEIDILHRFAKQLLFYKDSPRVQTSIRLMDERISKIKELLDRTVELRITKTSIDPLKNTQQKRERKDE